MTTSIPTVYVNQLDHSLIIASTIGAVIAIALILVILTHISYNCYLQLYAPENSNVRKIPLLHTNVGKCIMVLSYIALTLYLISCISVAFLRSNVITGEHFNPYPSCSAAWLLGYLGNSGAKSFIYTAFLYRLYVSFNDSVHYVPKVQLIVVLCLIWGIYLFMVCATTSIIAIESPMVNCILPNGSVFCGTPGTWPTLFRECVLLIFVSDILFNCYILYAFISRLRKITSQWADTLFENEPQHFKRLDMSQHSRSSSGVMAQASDKKTAMRILKMSRLMMKLTFLVALTVASTWIAWGFAVFYTLASLLYTYDVIINSICLWLLLSISDRVWRGCVSVFYFPCCCFCLCPSLKHVDGLDGVEKVIAIKHSRIPTQSEAQFDDED